MTDREQIFCVLLLGAIYVAVHLWREFRQDA